MSINDINNAAAAMNQLKARYEGFLDDADGQIATRRAAYDNLASDLNGIVEDKFDLTIYVHPDDGDDGNEGNAGTPVKTIQEAYSRLIPGGYANIRLTRGHVYPVSKYDLACTQDASMVYINHSGDVNLPRPKIISQIDATGSAHVGGISGRGTRITTAHVDFETPVNETGLGLYPWDGLFQSYGWAEISISSCTITLGDSPLVGGFVGDFMNIGLNGVTFVRADGGDVSTGKILNGPSGGFLRVTTVALPSGETWADLIGKQVDAADGEVRNFVSNIQI